MTAWFPVLELPKKLASLCGEWVDDRTPPSSYNLSMLTRRQILLRTTRPSGVIQTCARNIYLDQKKSHVRIVWGLAKIKFEAILDKDMIRWKSVVPGQYSYVWKRPAQIPEAQIHATEEAKKTLQLVEKTDNIPPPPPPGLPHLHPPLAEAMIHVAEDPEMSLEITEQTDEDFPPPPGLLLLHPPLAEDAVHVAENPDMPLEIMEQTEEDFPPPPGLFHLHPPHFKAILDPVCLIFARHEGKYHPATLEAWIDDAKTLCLVSWTDTTQSVLKASQIMPAL